MKPAAVPPDSAPFWLEGTFILAVAVSIVSIPASSVLLGAALLAAVAERLRRRDRPLYWPPVVAPLTLYAVTTLVALALSPEPTLGWGSARKLVLLPIVLLAPFALRSGKSVRRAFAVVAVVGSLSALTGAWQFVFGVDPFRSLHHHFPVDPSRPLRVTGFMSHWMTFSGQMLLVSLIAAAYAFFGEQRHRRLWGVAALLTMAGVTLSLTRSSWFALFVGLVVLVWWWKRVLVAVLVLLLPMAWLGAPDLFKARVAALKNPLYGPLATRADAIQVGLNIMREHPLLGIGPGRMDHVFWQYDLHPESPDRAHTFTGHLHNNVLQLAAERGIPCALSFLWLVGMVLWAARQGYHQARRDPLRAPAAAAAFAGMLAFFLAGLFEFNFGDSEVLSLVLLLSVTPYLVAERPAPNVRGILRVLGGGRQAGGQTSG